MNPLLAAIQALETELHHPGARCDAARLQLLLHADFHEVGRSGRSYDRATVIQYLAEKESPARVLSSDFSLLHPAPGVALLTYRSAQRREDGGLENHTLRSSLWIRVAGQWQLRYHQGTPAAQLW
jgi:hypothetical protein